MTIYADVFFFINMFEDFLLLLCVKRIIHSNIKYIRLISASLTGAILSFSAFLPFNIFPINILITAIISIIITLICFGFKSRGYFIKVSASLFIITMLFSGAMIFLYLALKPADMTVINNAVYFNISPLLLIVLTLIIYIILFFFRRIFSNHINKNKLYSIKFLFKNKRYNVKCKVDSGCNVKEPFSGSRAVIVENSIMQNFDKEKDNFRLIPFKSLGGNGLLLSFKAEEFYINDRRLNEEIYIALYNGSFSAEIQGLIPDSILKD